MQHATDARTGSSADDRPERPTSMSLADALPQIYDALRRLAQAQLSNRPPQTLQATAIVHEAFLRLLRKHGDRCQSTRQLFFSAARAIHDLLVERARQRACLKRGGGRRRVALDGLSTPADAPPETLLALHRSLELLRHDSPRQHALVLLRFFAGLTEPQAAAVLGISLRTAQREWRFVRARLRHELSPDHS
ncbi:MAG: ECF-type sigma factor [Planctomycetota bacterium]|jgi:RNA polymerase sigma factor (TIGR02999 family)